MSKLILGQQVPDEYNQPVFTRIINALCGQLNQLSEGGINARYAAQSTVPSGAGISYAVGDLIWDSNATVTSGTIRLGWVCTAAGTGAAATFYELNLSGPGFTGTITTASLVGKTITVNKGIITTFA